MRPERFMTDTNKSAKDRRAKKQTSENGNRGNHLIPADVRVHLSSPALQGFKCKRAVNKFDGSVGRKPRRGRPSSGPKPTP